MADYYFERLLFTTGARPPDQQLTIRLDGITKGILHADERLDLPANGG